MDIPQGYKQTELGIIPENWEVQSFSQVFDMYPNNAYSRDCMNDNHGIIRNIHYGNVLIKYPAIVDVEKVSMPYLNEEVKVKTQKFLQSGDVIIADTAEDETVGKCVEIKNTINAKVVAGLHTFFCRPIRPFAMGWLGYYLNSSNYHNQLLPYITGIKVSSISKTSIQETKLLVPPIVEQQAIAEVLSDVDGLIAALDKKIAKKRLIKQGAMQQLLTGKKRLPGFTDLWVERELMTICDVLDNKRVPLNEEQRKSGVYPYCGANGVVDYIDQYIFEEDLILIAEDGGNFEQFETRPISYWMTGKYWVNNHAHVLKAKNDYNQKYIFYQLEHKDITDYIVSGTRTKLTRSQLDKIKILLPNFQSEQQAIATILSDMDKEIADLEAKRDKYRLLKSGMMQKLLTGQIRLRI